MDNPFRVFDEIRQAFLRYLDSPFRLRYEALLQERRALLDQDRQLYREPLVEPVAPYQLSGLKVADACAQLGLSQVIPGTRVPQNSKIPVESPLYLLTLIGIYS